MNLSSITTIALMNASCVNNSMLSVPFTSSVAILAAAAVELAIDISIIVM